MARHISRADGNESLHIFCQRFGPNVPEVAEISEVIKDEGAFKQALIELNPTLQTALSKKFMRILVDHALLVSKYSGNAPVAKPAFDKISKKELLLSADRVSKLCEELESALDTLLELGVPASLALPPDKDNRADVLRNDLLVTLSQKKKDIIAVRNIALACQSKFKTVGTKRDINPTDPLQEAFVKKLARIWTKAGHKVTTVVEGPFDQFLCLSYQAVTGREDHSSSATARSHALGAAREFEKNPKASENRKKLASRTRHTMRFNKFRSQVFTQEIEKLGDLEAQVFKGVDET